MPGTLAVVPRLAVNVWTKNSQATLIMYVLFCNRYWKWYVNSFVKFVLLLNTKPLFYEEISLYWIWICAFWSKYWSMLRFDVSTKEFAVQASKLECPNLEITPNTLNIYKLKLNSQNHAHDHRLCLEQRGFCKVYPQFYFSCQISMCLNSFFPLF